MIKHISVSSTLSVDMATQYAYKFIYTNMCAKIELHGLTSMETNFEAVKKFRFTESIAHTFTVKVLSRDRRFQERNAIQIPPVVL